MQSLGPATRRDPAPSRLGYRFQRLMLTPGVRRAIRIGLPLMLLAIIVTTWFANPGNREMLQQRIETIISSIEERPEFMVNVMSVEAQDGDLTPELMQAIRVALPVNFPMSSFDMDLESYREQVEAIPAVDQAMLRIRPGGILEVAVAVRIPVAIWRQGEALLLIDSSGVVMGNLSERASRIDLPLIAGDGAHSVIAEALKIFEVAGPLAPRVRGLVRMGERRWDVVLDRGQRLMLPSRNPISSFERIVAMNQAQDLLDREVTVIDLRNENRPTIRLGENAAAEMRRINASVSGTGN